MIHPELDAEQLYAQLEAAIKPALAGTDRLAVVGIYSGGAWLAERLAHALGVTDVGYVDVSFYRDDVAERGLSAEVKPSQVPFDVDGATILLVDDVLYTGRMTRAAINTLFDYGRPAKIMRNLDGGTSELQKTEFTYNAQGNVTLKTDPLSSSMMEMKSPFKLETKGFDSCSSPESHSRNRSPGTGRSS